MNSKSLAGVTAALLLCRLAPCAKAIPLPERSVSSSRQFIVYGNDGRLRGAICDLAERSKTEVLHLLGQRDEWKTPVVIQARYPQADQPGAPSARLKLSQTGAGLKFQLEFCLGNEVNIPETENELLRVIYLEIIYRNQPGIAPGTPFAQPPDWLLEGTRALSTANDFHPIAQTLATAAASNVITLEEFLRQKRTLLDSPSQSLYRAYSAALLSILIDAPEGRARLARFLSDLPNFPPDPVEDLRIHFSQLGASLAQLEKTWRASVVRLASHEPYRVLNCEEAEHALGEILRINVSASTPRNGYALEEFPAFLRDPAAATELQRLAADLLALAARSHPLYQPIIAEYQQIVARLLRRKVSKIPQRLANGRALREQLTRRISEIGDYMNWFEATQARTASGAFREYLRAAEAAQAAEPRRRDPISIYLDSLETQF